MHAGQQYFTVWLAEQLVADGLHSPSLPSLYISWQFGVVIVFHVRSFYLLAVFLILLFQRFSSLLMLLQSNLNYPDFLII